MSSPLAAIWPADFSRTFPVWGKSVTLRSLDNAEIEEVNLTAATAPEATRDQATAMLMVASSIISIDDKTFTDPRTNEELSLQEKIAEVQGWPDVLTAVIYRKYLALQNEHQQIIEGLTDPNISGGRTPTTRRSKRTGSSASVPLTTSDLPG